MAAGSIRRVDHLCANTHRRVHHLFNLYVHANGAPPAAVLQSFRKIERDLAAYAWTNADHSGPGHLPYTIASGIVAPEAEAEFVRLMEAA